MSTHTATESATLAKANRMIAELMDALDIIRREAELHEPSRHYILGAAEQAMKQCDAQRERNSDGYLVVKGSR